MLCGLHGLMHEHRVVGEELRNAERRRAEQLECAGQDVGVERGEHLLVPACGVIGVGDERPDECLLVGVRDRQRDGPVVVILLLG